MGHKFNLEKYSLIGIHLTVCEYCLPVRLENSKKLYSLVP